MTFGAGGHVWADSAAPTLCCITLFGCHFMNNSQVVCCCPVAAEAGGGGGSYQSFVSSNSVAERLQLTQMEPPQQVCHGRTFARRFSPCSYGIPAKDLRETFAVVDLPSCSLQQILTQEFGQTWLAKVCYGLAAEAEA